jgi:hypothetical protein
MFIREALEKHAAFFTDACTARITKQPVYVSEAHRPNAIGEICL